MRPHRTRRRRARSRSTRSVGRRIRSTGGGLILIAKQREESFARYANRPADPDVRKVASPDRLVRRSARDAQRLRCFLDGEDERKLRHVPALPRTGRLPAPQALPQCLLGSERSASFVPIPRGRRSAPCAAPRTRGLRVTDQTPRESSEGERERSVGRPRANLLSVHAASGVVAPRWRSVGSVPARMWCLLRPVLASALTLRRHDGRGRGPVPTP